MARYIIQDALILTRDRTKADDGSLVVILPDGETEPIVSVIEFQESDILFVSNDENSQIYTVDNATILGDVISITYSYNNV